MYRITWKTHIICILISLSVVLIFHGSITEMMESFILHGMPEIPSGNIVLNFYIWLFTLTMVVSVIHELVHGFMYRMLGGRVKFGFRFIYAYTREISGLRMKRYEFILILLSPLFSISIFSYPLGYAGKMIFLINLLGSSGDAYMAVIAARKGKGCRIVDRSYGFDIN